MRLETPNIGGTRIFTDARAPVGEDFQEIFMADQPVASEIRPTGHHVEEVGGTGVFAEIVVPKRAHKGGLLVDGDGEAQLIVRGDVV